MNHYLFSDFLWQVLYHWLVSYQSFLCYCLFQILSFNRGTGRKEGKAEAHCEPTTDFLKYDVARDAFDFLVLRKKYLRGYLVTL